MTEKMQMAGQQRRKLSTYNLNSFLFPVKSLLLFHGAKNGKHSKKMSPDPLF